MTRLASLIVGTTIVLGSLFGPAGIAVAEEQTAICGKIEFEGARFTVCTVEPVELRLHWRGADGRPYRSFGMLADALRAEGETLRFAINAGMYDTDFRPIGIYVEDGETQVALNTSEAKPGQKPIPNFYKKPNGVFYVSGDTAAIVTSETFLAAPPEARIATQSGPMLVIDGELHPALIPGSTDRTRRGGVGICGDGEVIFAISDGTVNFHDFARLFRDGLGCPNALFLDGGRGVGLYDPEMGRNDVSWHGGYGPMLAVAGSGA
jgi:uncharacterized protein YigE (DUF2233 family)